MLTLLDLHKGAQRVGDDRWNYPEQLTMLSPPCSKPAAHAGGAFLIIDYGRNGNGATVLRRFADHAGWMCFIRQDADLFALGGFRRAPSRCAKNNGCR